MTGSCGATVSRGKEQTDAYPFFTQDGADRDPEAGAPYPVAYIANMRDGSVAGFKYFDLRDVKEICLQVRSRDASGARGSFFISDTLRGACCGTVEIQLNGCELTGAWEEFTGKVALPNGVSALYLEYRGTGALDFVRFTLKR